MTDLVTTAPIAIHKLRLRRVKFPKLRIGTKISLLSVSIGQAICMVYVEPYKIRQHQPTFFGEVDLEGRDPNW